MAIMVRNVFLKTLRDMRIALFWWSLAMFLFSLYYMSFYPSMAKDTENLQDMMDNMPDSFKAMMGGEVDLSTPEGFLSLEAFSFFYPILFLAFAVIYGAGIIGSEEENSTFDLLLSTPIRRWRVVLEKYAALVTFTLIVLLLSYLGFWFGAIVAGVDDFPESDILFGTLNMFPLIMFFAALALMLTGIRGGRGLALGGVLGLAAITYLVDTMSEVAHVPDVLVKLSPWHYYNGANVLREGFELGNIALLLGLSIVFVAAALWGFERRDVGI
jgi:ABC-2 type transport system permease protein